MEWIYSFRRPIFFSSFFFLPFPLKLSKTQSTVCTAAGKVDCSKHRMSIIDAATRCWSPEMRGGIIVILVLHNKCAKNQKHSVEWKRDMNNESGSRRPATPVLHLLVVVITYICFSILAQKTFKTFTIGKTKAYFTEGVKKIACLQEGKNENRLVSFCAVVSRWNSQSGKVESLPVVRRWSQPACQCLTEIQK